MSRWSLGKVTARTSTNCFALGLINASAGTSNPADAALDALGMEISRAHATLSGWELLGHGIFSSVRSNLWRLVTPMIALVLLSLALAFRRWCEPLVTL